jgi:hypothetical protein
VSGQGAPAVAARMRLRESISATRGTIFQTACSGWRAPSLPGNASKKGREPCLAFSSRVAPRASAARRRSSSRPRARGSRDRAQWPTPHHPGRYARRRWHPATAGRAGRRDSPRRPCPARRAGRHAGRRRPARDRLRGGRPVPAQRRRRADADAPALPAHAPRPGTSHQHACSCGAACQSGALTPHAHEKPRLTGPMDALEATVPRREGQSPPRSVT